MDDRLVSQAELSRELGVSKPYISKLVKAGRFDTCFAPDGKKLYLAKTIKVYNKSLSKSRLTTKKTVKTPTKVIKTPEKEVKSAPKVVKSAPKPEKTVKMRGGKVVDVDEPEFSDDFSEEDNELLYNTDNIKELKKLLQKAQSPMHRAQIESTFWQAKTRRLAFLEQERELIPVNEAKQAIEAIFTPINTQLDNMPVQLKAHFPEVPEAVVTWLWNELDSIKTASAVEWGTND